MKSLACLAACTLASSALAQPSFTGLGFLPGQHPSTASGVNADGSIVAGVSGNVMFLWTASGGLQDLGTAAGAFGPVVTALSGDASTVVGYFQLPVGYRGFKWTLAGGFSILDPLDSQMPGAYSFANDVSYDGSVIVGASRPSTSSTERAVPWAQTGDKQNLFSGHLLGISSDGSIAAGNLSSGGPTHAARWTLSDGPVDLTPALFGTSTAAAISGDGSLIAGKIGESLYLFSTSAQPRLLAAPSVPGGRYYAYGMSDDGTTIVGQYWLQAAQPTEHAIVWNPSLGVVDLNTYLPTIGVNLAGWTLDRANAASADGTVIVGKGTHNGEAEAWVVRIPTGCLADVGTQGGFAGHDGQLNNNDFVAFISMFFGLDTRADRGVQGGIPGTDGLWDNNDFVVFIDQFFSGC